MTCYFRHLQEVFRKAQVTVTAENKHDLDKAIHSVVGVKYKNCPATWREVKKRIMENEEAFVSDLRRALRM
ncbi:MAG: hypothetical protein WED04_10735 [Promethearchaeati archaeon SRVP18_Atabeyarchaeia-1]